MTFLQIDSLSGLKNNQGFWDNFVWPLAVAIVIGIFLLLRQFVFKPRNKKTIKPSLNFNVDANDNITLQMENDLLSKLTLVKQLIRSNNSDDYEVNITPTFKTNKLDKYQIKEVELKVKHEATELKNKIEILLIRPFDTSIENSPEAIKTAVDGIIETQPFNVTGRTKLDIYRTYDPKISFPIFLTKEDFENICKQQNKTIESMQKELLIPTMCSMTIFPHQILLRQIIPALVNEIYRIKTQHAFDLTTKHWENIMSYEVGLG